MDPNNINKTGFCNSETDHIISNELKQYILTDILNRTSIKHDDNYAQYYNKKYKNNFKNPHIFCFKTFGSPYLLYCTKINNISYNILIDKKINKGHNLPKMFIVNYKFSEDIYNGSLFECELIRDNNTNWFILIGDVYFLKNVIFKKNFTIIERINKLYKVLDNEFTENDFLNICNIRVKKYFDIADYENVINNYIKTLNYKIRGIYIVPINVNFMNIIYIYTDQDRLLLYSNNDNNNMNMNINFKVVKGNKPEIYDIFLKAPNGFQKIDILHIHNIDFSKYIFEQLRNKESIILSCKYNNQFKKWEGITISTKTINHINDIKI